MMVVSLDRIEKVREAVGVLIKQKQAGDRSPYLLEEIAKYEASITQLIVNYHAQPDCPCCGKGKMLPTTTKGRLGCERCLAVTLVGHVL